MASILIVDDDAIMCDMLADMADDMGHLAETAHTLFRGVELATSNQIDVVFLDVHMPDGNGLEVIPQLKKTQHNPEIIIITGSGDQNSAELAIKNGAWDYIQKTTSTKDIKLSLQRALEYRGQKEQHKPPVILKRDAIIGDSIKIGQCLQQLAYAAHVDTNVLITGETGTGKELFAQALHQNSTRVSNSFVVVDCAALPSSLIESMLFGHEKGAFTGADRYRQGLIGQANGGTLFLDEVGELPLGLQKALLRVLQERRYRPLGSKQELHSNFRLVSATNRNLGEMVESMSFRKDLFYRIQTVTIHLPPLRERKEDIKSIVRHCMTTLCSQSGMMEKGFSPDFFEVLENYQWPGNVRELIGTIEKVLGELHDEATLFSRHLPTHIRTEAVRKRIHTKAINKTIPQEDAAAPPSLRDHMDAMRIQYLKRLMAHSNGKVSDACRVAGISRARLYQLLKKHSIPTKV